MESRVIQPTKEALQEAAKRIQQGQLVAFPTETVYGLGANALDTEACANIFKTKGKGYCNW